MLRFLSLCLLALALAPDVIAQGTYQVSLGNQTYSVFLGTNAQGVRVVYLDEQEMAGWTWVIMDTDGDNQVDDIRVTEPGGGVADLVDGAGAVVGDSGSVHDGNVEYPNNKSGEWVK